MKLIENYKEIVSKIDKIFESYVTLNEVYLETFSNLKTELTNTSASEDKKIDRRIEIFKSQMESVEIKQKEISGQLFGQGLVLLTGSAESILREFFKNLVILNPDHINEERAKGIKLSFDEIRKKADISDPQWLGKLLYDELVAGKNPESKLNLQNMQQMKNIFSDYLGLEIKSDSLIQSLHHYWMIRHILIHNSGVIDQRFLVNLQAAEITTEGYKLGEEVSVTKKDYEACKGLYLELFKNIENMVEDSHLILDEVS